MKLRDYLKQKKLSESSFAELLQVSQAHVNRILNGKGYPSAKLANKIQKITKGVVTVEDMIRIREKGKTELEQQLEELDRRIKYLEEKI